MAEKTKATGLLTVSLLLEQNPEEAAPMSLLLGGGEQIRKAILAAIADLLSERPDVRVEWVSSSIVPLDGKPAVGRCAVCNCWVYDAENATDATPTGISAGAVMGEKYLCDLHLPKDHAAAF